MKKRVLLFIFSWLVGLSSFSFNHIVTNLNDSGSGSLREAISIANANDTVSFDVSGTILFQSEIIWDKSLTILGPGRDDLLLDGAGQTRLFNVGGGLNVLKDMSFTNGGGVSFGGCVLVGGFFSDSIAVVNCNFSNSTVSDAGGALFCGSFNLDNCFIDNCHAASQGGAIISYGGEFAEIKNTTVLNCSASNGGAIYSLGLEEYLIENCTFVNNQAGTGGGDIESIDAGITFINNTFSNNLSGLSSINTDNNSSGILTFQNNIFDSNSGNYLGNITGNVSNGGNICSDGTMSSFLNNSNDLNNTNPLLSPLGLQYNGGDVPTIAISCASPAYNNGAFLGAPLTDQIAQTRYLSIDAGSFEFQPTIMDTFYVCQGESFTFYDGTITNNITTPVTHVSYFTDIIGCDSLRSTTVYKTNLPELSFLVIDASCGEDNGEINASIIGNGPFTTSWTNGEFTEDIQDLVANSYYLTVTDVNNCEAIGVATVSSNEIVITSTITDVPCVGLTSGAIDLAVTGTATPFAYQWTNGSTDQDLSNLPAGQYEVIVTDANDCESSMSFNVEQPDDFEANIVVTNSSHCNVALPDGEIDLTMTGGTPTLSYVWTDDSGTQIATTEDISLVGEGVYDLTVTDANGCSFQTSAQVSELGAPEITLVDVINAGCLNDGEIDIDITAANAIQSILWSNAEITEDVTGLSVGTYSVTVEDVVGCASNLVVDVQSYLPMPIEVCLVSVDTTTGTNLIVWEKPVSTTIDKFIIYRETAVSGEYLAVDSIDYADESKFTDLTAFPNLRSWRYKVSVLNNCGIESDLSESHKTIHIGISLALSGGYNLFWDDYEGFTYATFDVWRHTDLAGWQLIQSMSTSNFSYFDNPVSSAGLKYFISVSPPSLCQSTKAQDHNASRSNTTSSSISSGNGTDGVLENDANNVLISPNPSMDLFYISSQISSDYKVSIYDMNGRIVKSFLGNESNFKLDLSNFENGIYILEIKTDDSVIREELVKQ